MLKDAWFLKGNKILDSSIPYSIDTNRKGKRE